MSDQMNLLRAVCDGDTPVGPIPYGERPQLYPTRAFYNDDGTVTYVHHGPNGPTWSETKPQPPKPEHDVDSHTKTL